ncbi:MAG: hemerythrin domain-containing protein [Elusimicrobiota bacterium]|jgi:hemerythrin-like domain-containing protein
MEAAKRKEARNMAEWRLLGQAWHSHEDLREILRVLRGLPRELADPEIVKKIGPKLRVFLEESLPAHFKEEEDESFRRAMECAPAARRQAVLHAINAARQEHDLMAAISRAIIASLADLSRVPRKAGIERMEALMAGLCDVLARHADKEDREVLPYLDLPEDC